MTNILWLSPRLFQRSKANAAMNSVTAQIPQETKDFMENAKNKLLDKDRLRSATVFFGIGESKSFSIACQPNVLFPRLKHNLFFFYLNYILLCAFVFVLTTLAVLITPKSLIVLGCLAVAWLFVIQSTKEGYFVVKGITVTRKQASLVMMITSGIVVFFLLKDIFWITILLTNKTCINHLEQLIFSVK